MVNAVTQGLKAYPCLGMKPTVAVTFQIAKLWELAVMCTEEVGANRYLHRRLKVFRVLTTANLTTEDCSHHEKSGGLGSTSVGRLIVIDPPSPFFNLCFRLDC